MNNKHLYAPGTHLLLDFFDVKNVHSTAVIQNVLHEAALACRATVLEIKVHSFGEDGGITGIALLAESHISIHTWPEIGFVALDVFVCGDCDARLAIEPLTKLFQPVKMNVQEMKRGAL